MKLKAVVFLFMLHASNIDPVNLKVWLLAYKYLAFLLVIIIRTKVQAIEQSSNLLFLNIISICKLDTDLTV
jgi:hypothetical protein